MRIQEPLASIGETDVQVHVEILLVERQATLQLHLQERRAIEVLRDKIRTSPVAAQTNCRKPVVGEDR